MVQFKVFDKKLKKFVSPERGLGKIWNLRYKLGIWDNSLPDHHVKQLYILMSGQPNFELYLKVGSKFEKASLENVNKIVSNNGKTKKQKNKSGGKTMRKKRKSKYRKSRRQKYSKKH